MTEPRDARQLRAQVIREITVAPGWNKEDATALVDELILSLPYIDDKNALAQPEPARVAAPSDGLREDIESLRTTAREQMDAAGALGSGAFFEGQVYAYDEVLRRILAAATPTDD
jgi:hypothetical protein